MAVDQLCDDVIRIYILGSIKKTAEEWCDNLTRQKVCSLSRYTLVSEVPLGILIYRKKGPTA